MNKKNIPQVKNINRASWYESRNDIISISSLGKVLIKQGIPFEYYSFNGYQEEAVCMEFWDSSWFIFYGEHGRRYEISKFSNIDSACREIIKRLSLDEENEKIMVKEFLNTKDWINKNGFAISVESEIVNLTEKIYRCVLKKKTDRLRSRIIADDLQSLVEHRKRLLNYIKDTDIETYNNLLKLLNINNDENKI